MSVILLVGPPGAGKGTQAARMSEKYGWRWVSTGDVLRSNIKGGSELGLKAKAYMDDGNLVPDSLLVDMLVNELEADKSGKTLLDGYPRNLAQAETLAGLGKIGEVEIVLHLDLDASILESRILKRAAEEGRSDDTPDKLKNRLRIYEKDTSPIIDFYKKRGVYRRINADSDVETVFSRITEAIDNL